MMTKTPIEISESLIKGHFKVKTGNYYYLVTFAETGHLVGFAHHMPNTISSNYDDMVWTRMTAYSDMTFDLGNSRTLVT